jgi:predicted outer membrane repeat protein
MSPCSLLLSAVFACLGLVAGLSPSASPVLAANTITVTSTSDTIPGACPSSTDCTLRKAIEVAAAGDTIAFRLPANSTIALNSARGIIILGKNLTIQGPGATSLAIDGGHATELFEVSNGVQVTMAGLTLQNAQAPLHVAGGAIRNLGTLTIQNCTLTENDAQSSGGDGGAIVSTGSLTVTDSTFTVNQANGGGRGGAIYSTGTLTITNTTFANNNSSDGGGAINMVGGTLTLTNGTFSQNETSGGGGGINMVSAGASTVTNSTFSQNSSAGGSILSGGDGGGIHAQGSTVTITQHHLRRQLGLPRRWHFLQARQQSDDRAQHVQPQQTPAAPATAMVVASTPTGAH